MIIYFYYDGYRGDHTIVSEGWVANWLYVLNEDEGVISVAWEILQ